MATSSKESNEERYNGQSGYDNGRIKFSDRDSEGNTLTKEQIEYFKDSKVRDKDGNLLVVRHGTSEDFHIFDFSKAGKNGKAEGAGFYFSDEMEITKRYGDIQKEVYLNITKPIYNTKRTVKKAELTKLVNDLIDFDSQKWEQNWKDSFISNYVNTYEFQMSRRYAVQQFVNQIWDYNTNDQDLIFEIAQADGRTYANDTMKEFYDILTESIGYDGIIAEWTHADGKSNVYVTFNSEQSKYTSNRKPTSNLDMRYSDRVIPTGIELPEGAKVDKSGKPRSAQAQRDAGYMLSENKFYQLYSAHKLTYGNRGEEIKSVIDKIKKDGFISSTSIANVLPTTTMRYFDYDANGKPKFNIVQFKYAHKKGDYVLFVPNNQITKDDIIKNGFKPLDYEIVAVEYDYQPYYELYTKAYERAYNQLNGGNGQVMYSYPAQINALSWQVCE